MGWFEDLFKDDDPEPAYFEEDEPDERDEAVRPDYDYEEE